MWDWLKRNVQGDDDSLLDFVERTKDSRHEERRPAKGTLSLLWQDEHDKSRSVVANIEDVSATGCGVTAGARFETGQELQIARADGVLKNAVVRYCLREGSAVWRIGLRVLDTERRRTHRTAVAGAGQIHWDEDGGDRSVSVLVRDISTLGAQVELQTPLDVDAEVRLSGEVTDCDAQVRYCIRRGEAYLVGLEFTRDPHRKGLLGPMLAD